MRSAAERSAGKKAEGAAAEADLTLWLCCARGACKGRARNKMVSARPTRFNLRMSPPNGLIAALDGQGAPMINRRRGVCQPPGNAGESGGVESTRPSSRLCAGKVECGHVILMTV